MKDIHVARVRKNLRGLADREGFAVDAAVLFLTALVAPGLVLNSFAPAFHKPAG